MARFGVIVYLKLLIIYATVSSLVDSLTLPNQVTSKPHHIKPSVTPSSKPLAPLASTASPESDEDGIALYRYVDKNDVTCILLKTDALVEVKFKLHGLEEQNSDFIPKTALVEGDCVHEDISFMRISWTGYSMTIYFSKTPGGERWYISRIELSVSIDMPKFHGIQTRGKTIKLYHPGMIIPTPVGKSYSCGELEIPLETDKADHPPPDVHGSLILRLVQIQPFMYKSEDFSTPFECRGQKMFRDETAPIAVGSTLAIAAVATVVGYAIYRYFKVKNVQYNAME